MATRSKSSRVLPLLVVLVLLVAVVGGLAWYKLRRELPQWKEPPDAEELFKYGSIGAESEAGIPYWIWLVLPSLFPEYLPGPGGYASLGMVWEEGRELPVGISKKTLGYERVGINCALCHSATLRPSADGVPTVYPGGPSSTFDALSYQRFLFQCASDPRFSSGTILNQIAAIYELSFLDRWLYRFLLIPGTKRALLEKKEEFAWTRSRADWGPGRIDPFNPVKLALLGLEVGNTVGNSDMEPIWNLGTREGMAYHWDGLNTELKEVLLSSALGDEATPESLPTEDLERVLVWLKELQPPAYPFDINSELAATGEALYQEHCASCHAFGGDKTGQVLPWAEVGTDRHRIDMWTPEAAEAYNAYGQRHGLDFQNFRAPEGYVNVPLDAVWIRAPYLHNGSVPTLRDLLEVPESRPSRFFRGLDVYDPQAVGFVSQGDDAARLGTPYDTGEAGNGNGGHLWGTDLLPEEKAALVEHMKTL